MKPVKISSSILYTVVGITLCIVIFLFFSEVTVSGSDTMPDSASVLISWMSILLGISVIALCVFFVIKFIQTFKRNPRTFWRNFLVFFGILVLLAITWFLGNGNPLLIDSYKGVGNVYFWLKLTDMFLYAIYVLLGLSILTIAGIQVYRFLKK